MATGTVEAQRLQALLRSPQARSALRLYRYRRDFRLLAAEQLKVKTKPPNPRIVPMFPLLDPQELVLQSIERQVREHGFVRHVVLKARQQGISTLSLGLLFQRAALHRNVNTFTAANDKATAENLFRVQRLFYESLDPSLRPKTRYSTKRELTFEDENDPESGLRSSMYVDSANNIHLGVSRTITALHLSEVARYEKSVDAIPSILGAIPLSPGTIILMESTAHVLGGYFRDMVYRAQREEGPWRLAFVPWFRSREYRLPLAPGEKIEPTLEEKHLIRQFGIPPSQIKWRRMKIGEYRGDEVMFRQDFPACVTGETRISTERGIIPIAEAQGCRETESGRIAGWREQPSSPIYRLVTQGKRMLRGTDDHPVMTPDRGFIRLADLHPGDRISLKAPRFAEALHQESWSRIPGADCRITVGEDWGRFLGYFLGDGCCSSYTLSISCFAKDEDVFQDIQHRWLRTIGPPANPRVSSMRPNCLEVRAGHALGVEHLARLRVVQRRKDNSWGRTYRVPDCIWRSPRHVVRAFLSGLFESDGSASENRVRWHTGYLEFARDVQLLLLGFGVDARIHRVRSQKIRKDGSLCVGYALDLGIEGAIRFFDEIGFVGARKRALRPFRRKREERAGGRWARRSMEDIVVEVIGEGDEVTYDLTVDPSHVFSANGILTHNTIDEAFIVIGQSIFPVAALRRLEEHVCEPRRQCEIVPEKNQVIDLPNGPLWIWADPVPGVEYDIGADVALEPDEQLEDGLLQGENVQREVVTDYSTIQVVRRGTLEQVAEWQGRVQPIRLAELAATVGYYYNTAQIAPESRGIGISTTSHLQLVLRYPNLYRWRYRDRIGTGLTKFTGWDTTDRSKEYLIAFALDLVSRRKPEEPLVRSRRLLEEMSAFVRDGRGRYRAAAGYFDDLVMAWLIAVVTSNDEDFSKFVDVRESAEARNAERFYEPGKGPRRLDVDPAMTEADADGRPAVLERCEIHGW